MLKPKPTKKCKYCGKTFKPRTTLDKYCSPACLAKGEYYKAAKPRTKLNPISNKLKTEKAVYKKLHASFMAKPENMFCPVIRELYGRNEPATEVHHRAGRTGKLLNYVPYWLAVSREGHMYIHDHPEESYKKGWMYKRNEVDHDKI